MDPVEPWIDVDAVRRMARQLTVPAERKRAVSPDDPGFGPVFEGFLVGDPGKGGATAEAVLEPVVKPVVEPAPKPPVLPEKRVEPVKPVEEPDEKLLEPPIEKSPTPSIERRSMAARDTASVDSDRRFRPPAMIPVQPIVRTVLERNGDRWADDKNRPKPESKKTEEEDPSVKRSTVRSMLTPSIPPRRPQAIPAPRAGQAIRPGKVAAPPVPRENPGEDLPRVAPQADPRKENHAKDEPKPFLVKAPGAKPAPAPPDATEGPRGPLVARLERFRAWLIGKAGASGMFVLDREGEPVVDDPKFTKLHFLARSLAQAYRPVEGESGNVHVKVGSQAYLAVVPVETEFGNLVLGAVLPAPLDAAAVEVVARGLAEAARPERR